MLTAAQLREKFAQGASSSAAAHSKPTSERVKGSAPTDGESNRQETIEPEAVQSKSTKVGATVDKVGDKRPKRLPPAGPKKKTKVVESEEEDEGFVYTPDWNVDEDDTLFGTAAEGRKADPVELLKGLCLPKDKKRLALHKSSDEIRAVAQLLAKVCIYMRIYFQILEHLLILHSCRRAVLGSVNWWRILTMRRRT